MDIIRFLLLFSILQQDCALNDSMNMANHHRLPSYIAPTLYKLNFTLEKNFYEKKKFAGEVEIHFITRQDMSNSKSVILNTKNLKLKQFELSDSINHKKIKIEEHTTNAKYERTLIKLETELVKNGSYKLVIGYEGELRLEEHGFYLTKFVQNNVVEWLAVINAFPTHAREVFPCFDEPQFKTKFSLTVAHPNSHKAVSNSELLSKKTNGGKDSSLVISTFRETKPLSPHNLALVVSNLQQHCISFPHKVEHNFWIRSDLEGNKTPALLTAPQIMDKLVYRLGDLCEITGLTRIHYVAVPHGSLRSANWAIIISSEGIIWNQHESSVYFKQIASLELAHSLSHMWFNNIRTPAWWNDAWLSEGFGDFMSYSVLEEVREWDVMEQYIVDVLHVAMQMDTFRSTKPLFVDPSKVLTPMQIEEKCIDISYKKATAVLAMLRNFVGTNVFHQGLHRFMSQDFKPYFTTIECGELWNAWPSNQLADILPPEKSLKEVMEPWIKKPGYPVVTVKKHLLKVTLEAKPFRYGKPTEEINKDWFIPISYTTAKDTSFSQHKVNSTNWIVKDEPLILDVDLSEAHNWIIVNLQASFYYRVNYDNTLWARIQKALWKNHTEIHPANRAQIISDVFNFARSGLVTYDRALDIVAYLKDETEYIPLKAAFEELHTIKRRVFYDKKIRVAVNQFVALLLKNTLKRILKVLNAPSRKLKHKDILKNRILMYWTCEVAMHACINYTNTHFENFIYRNQQVLPNERSYVYCSGIYYESSKNGWNTLYRRIDQIKQPSEAQVIIDALACSRRKDILRWYLNQTINSESQIEQHNIHKIFMAVIERTHHGTEVGLQFFTDNFQRIYDRYKSPRDLIEAINKLADMLRTAHQIEIFQHFVETEDIGDLRQVAQQALERSKENLAWKEEQKGSLASALEGRLKSKRSTDRSSFLQLSEVNFSLSIILVYYIQ